MATRSTHRRGSDQRGLTLVEMAITLVILAIVALLSFPGLRQLLESVVARGVPHLLVEELQKARSSAVMENNRFHFGLVPGSDHRYRIWDDDDNDGVFDLGERSTEHDLRQEAGGATMTVSGPISFAPNGSAPSPGTITVTTAGGTTTTIRVSPAGRIRIE